MKSSLSSQAFASRRLHASGPRAAAFSTLLALTACTAPGMKLNVRATETPTQTQINGLSLTLRRLDSQAIQAASVQIPMAPPELTLEKPRPYLIGAQDVLIVTVWDHPEITLALGQYRTDNASGNVVDEDGTIFFPYVGKLKVGGLSVTEARTALTRELARTLQNPQVDVKVLAFRSQKVYVGGEVKTPATYTVTDVPFTLSEAINRAGGFSPIADDSSLLLTRGSRTWTLDFQGLMARGGQGNRIYLQDGDSLFVPNNQERPVFMLGEVVKPGSVPLNHGTLSLAKAISDAGGLMGTSADARSIYVLRQGRTPDAVEVFHLDARNPAAMVLADRFPLHPRDFVFVDGGTLTRFNRVMASILPTYSAAVSTGLSAAEYHYFRTRN
jgi:polysaccharide biosynthesis/export protein